MNNSLTRYVQRSAPATEMRRVHGACSSDDSQLAAEASAVRQRRPERGAATVADPSRSNAASAPASRTGKSGPSRRVSVRRMERPVGAYCSLAGWPLPAQHERRQRVGMRRAAFVELRQRQKAQGFGRRPQPASVVEEEKPLARLQSRPILGPSSAGSAQFVGHQHPGASDEERETQLVEAAHR